MDVSIILPSYNGAETLPRTLAALDRVVAPPGGMEIILVDNNSTDDTARLMQRFAEGRVVQVRSEPRQGKSHALNTALDAARGALVVFTDDDTLADPDWVMAYVRAAEAHPDISVFSGQIRPAFMETAPAWLARLTRMGRSCACTPADLPEGSIAAYHAKGPNMMARLSDIGGVRFDVGVLNYGGANTGGGGEDTDFVQRVARSADTVIQYVPEALVHHIVRPNEMTLRAVIQRYIRIGMGQPQIQPYTRIGVAASILRSVALIAAYALTFQRHRAISQIVTLAAQTGRMKALMRR